MNRPPAATHPINNPELAGFLRPELNVYTMDVYAARVAITAFLTQALPRIHGAVIDLGCGVQPYRDLLLGPRSRAQKYIGVDLEDGYHQVPPDVIWNGRRVPLPDGSANTVLLTEVLEHCPNPQEVLTECYRLLAPGGVLLVTVPFFWPLHDNPYDEFRYTPFALRRMTEQAGFGTIEIRATGGWDASLAQMLGLWVRRRPMNEFWRRALQRCLLPVYRRLLRSDQPPENWEQQGMLPGLTMIASRK